jgi:hypothetical protein
MKKRKYPPKIDYARDPVFDDEGNFLGHRIPDPVVVRDILLAVAKWAEKNKEIPPSTEEQGDKIYTQGKKKRKSSIDKKFKFTFYFN